MPGMTVLQNIMLGLPKKTRFGLVDWPAIARDVAPIAKRVGITAPLNANVQGAVDRRELADQHLPRAGAQGAAHRHGRADRVAVGQRMPKAVRHHPRPLGVGRGGALRLAPARRNPRPVRPRDRVPRRPLGRRTRRPGADASRPGRSDRRRRGGEPAESPRRGCPRRGRAVGARACGGCRRSRRRASNCIAARCSASAVWSAPAAASWPV